MGWHEDVNGMAVGDRIAQAEAILLNPDATHQELEQAKDLAEAINARDVGNPVSDDDGDDDDEEEESKGRERSRAG